MLHRASVEKNTVNTHTAPGAMSDTQQELSA